MRGSAAIHWFGGQNYELSDRSKDHASRLTVGLARESLDLRAITGSYVSGLGQPPFDPRMMVALCCIAMGAGLHSSRRIARA
jgi:hypothetical protein